jgi:hypothetical protein
VRQLELAEAIGATRSAVNRQLAKWLREDIVGYRDGVMVVLDDAALREFIASG